MEAPIKELNTYQQLFKLAEKKDSGLNTYNDTILGKMLKNISTKYKEFNPHVNGYYYIHMQHGPWITGYKKLQSEVEVKKPKNADLLGVNDIDITGFNESYGMCATDIDIPQLNIDYDIVSGKSKIINYASKMHFAGDFNINYLETAKLNIFKYHAAWNKYIELARKGYKLGIIPSKDDGADTIDIPYFNAVYVVMFNQFTNKPSGIIKILGVSPVNLPIKQIIGDRSKSSLSTLAQSYKSNDISFSIFDERGYKDDILWNQFKKSFK